MGDRSVISGELSTAVLFTPKDGRLKRNAPMMKTASQNDLVPDFKNSSLHGQDSRRQFHCPLIPAPESKASKFQIGICTFVWFSANYPTLKEKASYFHDKTCAYKSQSISIVFSKSFYLRIRIRKKKERGEKKSLSTDDFFEPV